MAEADRILKTGDTFPPHVRVIEDANGPRDLSSADQVRILARKANTLISDTCTVMTIQEGLDTGWLTGTWQIADLDIPAAVLWDIDPGDTAVSGAFEYEYEITWAVGDVETVPNRRSQNPVLTIDSDLD